MYTLMYLSFNYNVISRSVDQRVLSLTWKSGKHGDVVCVNFTPCCFDRKTSSNFQFKATHLERGYSSVAVHLTADQEVPSSTLGAPYLVYTKMYLSTEFIVISRTFDHRLLSLTWKSGKHGDIVCLKFSQCCFERKTSLNFQFMATQL